MTSPQYSCKVRIFLTVVCPHLVGSTVLFDPPRLVPRLRQYLAIFPGLAIILLVLAFNFFGDGLRDALDPKLK